MHAQSHEMFFENYNINEQPEKMAGIKIKFLCIIYIVITIQQF